VSADLAALARTPVAVVCSGVKSILDVPATLEYLETLGVPVVGVRTGRFPGFYLTNSGSPLDWAVSSEEETARVIQALPGLGFERSGLVVANPLPKEEQLDPELHDRALRAGLEELGKRGVRGRDVTPFLLDRFATESKGESLRVNKEIILQNAGLAARIAAALSALDGAGR
jgi:pseudouridine-5'-phosphate glycosidase